MNHSRSPVTAIRRAKFVEVVSARASFIRREFRKQKENLTIAVKKEVQLEPKTLVYLFSLTASAACCRQGAINANPFRLAVSGGRENGLARCDRPWLRTHRSACQQTDRR